MNMLRVAPVTALFLVAGIADLGAAFNDDPGVCF